MKNRETWTAQEWGEFWNRLMKIAEGPLHVAAEDQKEGKFGASMAHAEYKMLDTLYNFLHTLMEKNENEEFKPLSEELAYKDSWQDEFL